MFGFLERSRSNRYYMFLSHTTAGLQPINVRVLPETNITPWKSPLDFQRFLLETTIFWRKPLVLGSVSWNGESETWFSPWDSRSPADTALHLNNRHKHHLQPLVSGRVNPTERPSSPKLSNLGRTKAKLLLRWFFWNGAPAWGVVPTCRHAWKTSLTNGQHAIGMLQWWIFDCFYCMSALKKSNESSKWSSQVIEKDLQLIFRLRCLCKHRSASTLSRLIIWWIFYMYEFANC